MSQAPVEIINPTPTHINSIMRLYYGDLPLDVTFWAFFGTAVVFLHVLIPREVSNLILKYGAQGLLYITVPRYIFLVGFTFIVLVGQWRAANKYTGKKIWAILVKIITGVAALDCARRIPDLWQMTVALVKYG